MKKNTTSKNTKNTNTTAMRKDTTMKKNMDTNKMNAEQITDSIIFEALDNEERVESWFKAWTESDYYVSRHGREYSAYNKMLLAMQGAPTGEYLTKKQALAEHGDIRKEKNIQWFKVIGNFPKDHIKKDAEGNAVLDKDGKEQHFTTYHAKYYKVCNAEDAGLKNKRKRTEEKPTLTEDDFVVFADNIINEYITREGVKFKNRSTSNVAYYSPMDDIVRIPRIEQYKEVTEYYSVAFHELTHSTGHWNRRHRFEKGTGKFGSKDYSKEELVAESGAVLALARLGIATREAFINSIAYIKGWLKKADKNENTKRNTLFASITSAESAVRLIFEGK